MKKTIYTFATILCLLTIGIGSTCFIIGTHQEQACNHCPKPAPLHQPTTSCCTSHHQPSSTTAFAQIEQPTALVAVSNPLPQAILNTVQLRNSLSASPPPLRPLIALRI